MAYVYRHIRLDKNEPFYIGISKNSNNYKRAYDKHRRGRYWHHIVAQTVYEVEILKDNISDEEAMRSETEFIKLYGREDLGEGPLCNNTDGGEGFVNPSKERRAELSRTKKGNKYFLGRKHSEETKRKLSASKSGVNAPMYGKKHTKEALEKMSKSQIGKYVSPETRRKISLAGMGKPAHNKGVPASKKERKRLAARAASIRKPVLKYSIEGAFIAEYKSVLQAAKSENCGQGNVTHCCKGRCYMYAGFLWRFKTENYPLRIKAFIPSHKEVIQYSLNGELIKQHESLRAAARDLGAYKSTIQRACERDNNRTLGYMWKYKNAV